MSAADQSTTVLPRMLADFSPARGVIKEDYEDFLVEEAPLYPADGVGTHTYFLVEKAGLSTMHAISNIATALDVRRFDIGYAGLKDARAVTRQWMSVEHVAPEKVRGLQIPRIRIVEVTQHRNKLRLGHLKGNRFTIRIRRTETDRLAELQDALWQLGARGVPNYFGPQRFGARGDTWAIGRAMLRRDLEEALNVMLGRPGPGDVGDIRRARQHFDAGRYAEAARAWPGMFADERRALRVLAQTEGNRKRAFGAIHRNTRRFYVSAYQSHLFNSVTAARMERGLDRVLEGDLAWLHASGAVFRVENPDAEQERAQRGEISPSGPLFGYRMTEPSGFEAELETQVLKNEELEPASFRSGPLRVTGGRRPMRFMPQEAKLRLATDGRGAYFELGIFLPRGCYATVLLRELFALDAATVDDEADEQESGE